MFHFFLNIEVKGILDLTHGLKSCEKSCYWLSKMAKFLAGQRVKYHDYTQYKYQQIYLPWSVITSVQTKTGEFKLASGDLAELKIHWRSYNVHVSKSLCTGSKTISLSYTQTHPHGFNISSYSHHRFQLVPWWILLVAIQYLKLVKEKLYSIIFTIYVIWFMDNYYLQSLSVLGNTYSRDWCRFEPYCPHYRKYWQFCKQGLMELTICLQLV